MVGTAEDVLARLKAVLPIRWFPDSSPVLDGLLGSLSWTWQWLYGLLSFVQAQTRIRTASGFWLNVISQDFFGARLSRRVGQSDLAFRRRIQTELLRDRNTRAAIRAILLDVTGREPEIFEPARATDTGGYGIQAVGGGGLAYGVSGKWGSLKLPMQCFVTAYRPHGAGIASVAGWGTKVGGYGQGGIEYASLSMVQGQVTDADIYTAVADVVPTATIAWTQISN